MTGESVVIVNRTSKVLEAKQNGRVLRLHPGKNHVTSDWIRFAKLQNPRMGSFDPSGLQGDYLVGVEGVDDCSMIAPGQEHKAGSHERFDRSLMDDEASQAVEIPTGITPPKRRVPSEMGGIGSDIVFTGDR